VPVRLKGITIEGFRFATRVLLKSHAYSLVALVTLALGIGAPVAIFSAVSAVLLAPLPYPDPDALVVPVSTNAARGFERASVPYADYLDWRGQRDIFTHVAVWQPTAVDVAGSTAMPERVEAAEVGEAFFDVLGVRPLVGRTFEAADQDLKSARVAVIGYGLWQRTLGGVPDVLDRDLRIGGVPLRVVGVLPPDSMWPVEEQIWLPLRSAAVRRERAVPARQLHLSGHRAPGAWRNDCRWTHASRIAKVVDSSLVSYSRQLAARSA
jgi:putative ABC transport system permease protein